MRNAKLSTDPLCERCLTRGITRAAVVVHHIKPLEDYIGTPRLMLALAYDSSNLLSLCTDCHTAIHVELQSKTKAKTKEREREKLLYFVRKFGLQEVEKME